MTGRQSSPERTHAKVHAAGDQVYICSPRGIGPTRWTRKDPPNYVERAHVLLGRTVDAGRVWDLIATARYLVEKHDAKVPLCIVGEGSGAVLAAYAALWEPEIAGLLLQKPPLSHAEPDAPALLNILRVCDVPDVLGMLAPRPMTIDGVGSELLDKVWAAYAAAGDPAKLVIKPNK